MSRFIDADAIKIRRGVYIDFLRDITAISLKSDIDNTPTADVSPVVHSKWITKFGEFPNICCVCNKQAREKTEYCPNCGAKMDEREEEDGEIH